MKTKNLINLNNNGFIEFLLLWFSILSTINFEPIYHYIMKNDSTFMKSKNLINSHNIHKNLNHFHYVYDKMIQI